MGKEEETQTTQGRRINKLTEDKFISYSGKVRKYAEQDLPIGIKLNHTAQAGQNGTQVIVLQEFGT